MTAKALIERLELIPHPEGGHYRETYRSDMSVLLDGRERSVSTAILYLLSGNAVSRLHRIDADEVWHHYQGGQINVLCLYENGAWEVLRISEEFPQAVVPAGTWFGACLDVGMEYALVGCTVAPGFEFDRFEIANRKVMLAGWPEASDWIARLT